MSSVETAGHQPFEVSFANVRALPLLRLFGLVSLMGMITYYHVARVWKYYHIKRTLTVHIAVGLVELFKFSFEDIFRNPVPGWFDFGITLYQSKNALSIIASLRKGDRKWSLKSLFENKAYTGLIGTGPIFHAAVLLRIYLSGYSVIAQSSSAYRVSIALDHGFIWDRLMLWGFMRVLPKYSTSYLLAQYLGALVSFETNSVEGGFLPLGGISLIFTAMMVGFRLFDEWNIIDMSMFEEKQAVDQKQAATTEAGCVLDAAPSTIAAPVVVQATNSEIAALIAEPEIEVLPEPEFVSAAPRLQVMTDSLGLSSMTSLDASTPTLDSASSSFSDGSMSPTSSLGSPLLTPQTPSVYQAPVAVDPFSAPSQAEKIRKMQELNGFAAVPEPVFVAAPAPEALEEALRAMPGGNAELWQPSKQDLRTAASVVGQAFCKFAAQSGFTSLDHYETLKKRKYTINNLEA